MAKVKGVKYKEPIIGLELRVEDREFRDVSINFTKDELKKFIDGLNSIYRDFNHEWYMFVSDGEDYKYRESD